MKKSSYHFINWCLSPFCNAFHLQRSFQPFLCQTDGCRETQNYLHWGLETSWHALKILENMERSFLEIEKDRPTDSPKTFPVIDTRSLVNINFKVAEQSTHTHTHCLIFCFLGLSLGMNVRATTSLTLERNFKKKICSCKRY